MGERPSGADRATVIEALVLAFANSDIQDVSPSGLRSALELQWDELFDGDALDLQEVLDLVPASEELEPARTDPPLCRIKVWEKDLGVEVRLPERLAELSTIDRDLLAADCSVPSEELQKVLRKHQRRQDRSHSKKVRAESRKVQAVAPTSTSPKFSEQGSRRSLLLVVAALVAVGGFATGGFFLWRELGQSVEMAPLPASLGDIPADDLGRRGAEAGAVLTDPGWWDEPAEMRRQQMAAALRELRSDGIEVLFLRGEEGNIRATAQFHETDEGRRIVVTFR